MKAFSDSALLDGDDDAPKDFTVEDLALFKEMLLDLEKAVDEIEVTPITGGTTFPGGFIFELLAKANVFFFPIYCQFHWNIDKFLCR